MYALNAGRHGDFGKAEPNKFKAHTLSTGSSSLREALENALAVETFLSGAVKH
ncbi:MAG: hypothetical protein U0361_04515 [Nitrospiraceae bacterium]